jgi:AraC-like DNA-binding protein
MIRVGAIRSAINLLQEFGVEPANVVRSVGLSPDIFDDPENEVPYLTVVRFLDLCARTSRVSHFGLLAGARNELSSAGLIGHLAKCAPFVGAALKSMIDNMPAHDRIAQARLTLEGEGAVLGYVVDRPATVGVDQLNDGAIAMYAKIMRGLCGDSWAPSLVKLPRRQPKDTGPYVKFFKAEVVFGSDVAALVFPASWLQTALPGADEALHAFLFRLASTAAGRLGSEVEEVRRIIRLQLIGRKPSIDRAASMLGIHRRTLERLLSREATTFRTLVQEMRFEIAGELMKNTNASMGAIAEMLGYSDSTAFSRAFSKRHGHPPSLVRKTSWSVHSDVRGQSTDQVRGRQ